MRAVWWTLMLFNPSGTASCRSSGGRATGRTWWKRDWRMSGGSAPERSRAATKKSIKKSYNTMCGIAGIIELKDGTVDGNLVRRMTDAIAHRGPDADGFFVEGSAGLGHRRLSIIDLSADSNQPFYDPSGRYVL